MKRRGFLQIGVSIAIGALGKFRLLGLDLPATQAQEVEKPLPETAYDVSAGNGDYWTIAVMPWPDDIVTFAGAA